MSTNSLKPSHFVQNKCPYSSKSVDIFISKKSDCGHFRTFSMSEIIQQTANCIQFGFADAFRNVSSILMDNSDNKTNITKKWTVQ